MPQTCCYLDHALFSRNSIDFYCQTLGLSPKWENILVETELGVIQTLGSRAVQPEVSLVIPLSCMYKMEINYSHLAELLGRVNRMTQARCLAKGLAHSIC